MEMIQYCREQYSDNLKQLDYINQFNKTYKPEKAVRWFTRNCFLYRLVNQALRLQDIDALYKMRFYIRDLQEQIFLQHIAFITKAKHLEPITVYRGFSMTKDDFEKLKTQEGGFMSVAEFMSTSSDEGIARGFAAGSVGAPDLVAILLQIEVDVKNFHTNFTAVRRQSWIPNEEETLFTMGNVFRIQKICVHEEDISLIKLSLNGEEDNELKLLYEHMRKNFMEPSPLSNLAKLMLTMGNYELAEKYYHMLLQDSEFIADSRKLSDVYYYLAQISIKTDQKDKVMEYYKKCLDIRNKHLSATDFSPTTILSNLGRIHRLQGDYETELLYFKQALDIESKASIQDKSKLAELYESLGIVYNKLQRYPEQLDMFEKALQIRLKLYPKNHPEISKSYNNIATGYVMQKGFEKAIDFYKKAIQIQVKSLQTNHPVLADTYNNLASALYEYGKLEEAVDYAKKAYEILSKKLSADHPKVKKTLKFITDTENELIKSKEEQTD
jgi:tetratricopeptide (TPR) repeat protein